MPGNISQEFTPQELEALVSFDNQIHSKSNVLGLHQDVDIGGFLKQYSPEIQEKIRPILELELLFRDHSQKVPQSYFESLLTEESFPKRFKFPRPSPGSIPSFEKRYSMIDDSYSPEFIKKLANQAKKVQCYEKRTQRYEKIMKLYDRVTGFFCRKK